MSTSFLHGVEVLEVSDGPRPITTVKTSVIGIVGTAPTADATLFPLNKPVLIMRDATERPEGVDAGVNMLVGTSAKAIVPATLDLLRHPEAIASMAARENPYGDGKAAQRIAEHLVRQ